LAVALRAGTRRISPSGRERGCGVLCVERGEEHPSIKVTREAGQCRATWQGILTCGHIWTCPVCSQTKKAARAEKIVRAVDHLGGEWVMLTVTLRHRHGMRLKWLRDGGMAAWRKTRQGGRVQRVWSEKVTASVRTQEVTYGENGWHWHVHVLLRTLPWDDDEKDALQERFERAVREELGEHCVPDDLHGLVWSTPFDASRASGQRATYLAKLGLESASLGKEGRGGSKTPWDIARAATKGDVRAKALWWEYFEATRGKRMIELDVRAATAAELALELVREAAPESSVMTETKRIEVQRDDVRALRFLEYRGLVGIMATVLQAAEDEGESGVREWVVYARSRMSSPSEHFREAG
jgi:hypothetical protein